MITINTRTELDELLYGENATHLDTLVGVACFGGELLAEALSNAYNQISDFFPYGDEGEFIVVDASGNVVEDEIYY